MDSLLSDLRDGFFLLPGRREGRPELLQLAQGRRWHRDATPVRGCGPQAGIEQREARALSGKAWNHLGAPSTFAVQSLEAIRRAYPLMMILGKAQSGQSQSGQKQGGQGGQKN